GGRPRRSAHRRGLWRRLGGPLARRRVRRRQPARLRRESSYAVASCVVSLIRIPCGVGAEGAAPCGEPPRRRFLYYDRTTHPSSVRSTELLPAQLYRDHVLEKH